MLVRDVIQAGIDAFNHGVDEKNCPYEPDDPQVVEGFHGSKSIGNVRIGIDWKLMWSIGWQIGKLVSQKKHAA